MANVTRALNAEVVKTSLDELFYPVFNTAMKSGHVDHSSSLVFNQSSMDSSAKVSAITQGIGEWSGTLEDANYSDSVFNTSASRAIQAIKFTKQVKITEEMIEDDQWDVVGVHVKDMARSGKVTKDKFAFDLYRGAFTSTQTLAADPLISATHTTIGGDTVSNLHSYTTGDGFEGNLDDMVISLYEQIGHDGTLKGSMPKTLLVPTARWKEARVLIDTPNVVGSDNNDVNVYSSQYNVSIATSPYLGSIVSAGSDTAFGAIAAGSDTAFFLIGDYHTVNRYTRTPVSTTYVAPEFAPNGVAQYRAKYRDGQEAVDYCGIVGTDGVQGV